MLMSADRTMETHNRPLRVSTTHGEVGKPSEARAELPAASRTAQLNNLIYGACGATTKTGESMSRLTATWLCRVRTLPRLRRAVLTRHRQHCESHRFAGHECPPAQDTNRCEPRCDI